MKELKNIDVSLISFVDKGANKRTVVYKSKDGSFDSAQDDRYTLKKEFARIAKVDEEKHLVYGVVYTPDEADAHDDFATAEEIEKAAHNFLAKSNTIKAMDTQHNLEVVEGVSIVESAIIKGSHSILEGEKDGTWFIVTKVDNEEIWKSVKDGTYTGYSLYGTAERIEEEVKSEKSNVKKRFERMLEKLEKFFNESEPADDSHTLSIKKSFDEVYQKMQLRTVADAIACAVWDAVYNDMLSLEERRAELQMVLADADRKLSAITLAKESTDEDVIKAGIDAANSLLEKSQNAKEILEKIKTAKAEGNTMEKITKEELEKAVADAVALEAAKVTKSEEEKAELQKKLDEQAAEIDTLTKDQGDLKAALEAIVEKSNGTKQVDGEAAADGKPVQKEVEVDFLGGEIKKKFGI